MKILYLIITLTIYNTIVFAQVKKQVFHGLTSDSLLSNHLIEIKDKSTIELRLIPTSALMQERFKMSFSYTVEGEKMIIHRNHSKEDSAALIRHGYQQFLKPVILNFDKKAMIDEEHKFLYVIYKDFSESYYSYFIIDGKEYKTRNGQVNSYGLITKSYRTNIRLKRKLRSIRNEIDNYEIIIYRGWEAYHKFGYDYIFGVFVLQRKK